MKGTEKRILLVGAGRMSLLTAALLGAGDRLNAMDFGGRGPRWRNNTPPINQALYVPPVGAGAAPNFISFAQAQNMFRAANAAGIASPAGLSASSTCFTLYNPATSGKTLYIMEICLAVSVFPTANLGGLWLVTNNTAAQAAPATTTNVSTVPGSTVEGSTAVSVAKAFSTATLAATPKVCRVLGMALWASGVGMEIDNIKDVVGGAVAVAPGSYVSIQAAAATTIQTSMTWVEF